MITYIVIGSIENPPTNGLVSLHPLVEPNASALYAKRVELMQTATTEFVCLLDGGADRLMPNFEACVERQMTEMNRLGVDVAYSDERSTSTNYCPAGEFTLDKFINKLTMMHHGVICRTSAVKNIEFPSGEYLFEAMCYGTLALTGYLYTPIEIYEWNPSINGARLWPSTVTASYNTWLWFHNIKTQRDLIKKALN